MAAMGYSAIGMTCATAPANDRLARRVNTAPARATTVTGQAS